MKDTTIAVDLAKNVFEIAISGERGTLSLSESLPAVPQLYVAASVPQLMQAINRLCASYRVLSRPGK